MKVSFKNSDLTNIKDLKDVFNQNLEDSMDDAVAYMLDQVQKNSPVTKNNVDLAEKVKVSKLKNGSKITYQIKVEHSSAFRYHEDLSINQKLIDQSSDIKVIGSETGGVGTKYLQRAIYNSKNKVLSFVEKDVEGKLSKKSLPQKLTTKKLEEFK